MLNSIGALLAGTLAISSAATLPDVAKWRAPTPEEVAFNQAASAFVLMVKTRQLGNFEKEWSEKLKMLARSRNPAADVYLSRLALFNLDGAIAEEFSCAASTRGIELSVELRKRLMQFHVHNYCLDLAKRNRVDSRRLCDRESDFRRTVTMFGSLPQQDSGEASCGD